MINSLSIPRFVLALLMLCICSAPAFAAQDFAAQGDSAYNKKDYRLALQRYNQAIEKHGVSSELYYNIGNTQYRLNRLGQAVIAYERALKLDPSNVKAARNLQFVNTKIADRPEDDSSFLYNLHRKIVSKLSPDGWAWTAFIVFTILVGMIAVYIFTSNITMRKVGFFGGILVLCVFVYTLINAWNTSREIDSHDTAVVIVPTTNLCSSPATPKDKTDKVVPIHEGTKLTIIDSLATPDDPASHLWYNVKINNTTSAWVPASDIEKI